MRGPGRCVEVLNYGLTEYREALVMQRRLHAARVAGAIEDTLLLTEHERVITLGRNADEGNIRVSSATLDERGIPVVRVERGGDVTYHGPGQIVAYPIVDLRAGSIAVRDYIRLLEQSAILLLECHGIAGERRSGTPGVWAEGRKIASVGVYVSRWVTMHGIAINLATDLADFELIHPCGLAGLVMTSVAEISGQAPSVRDATLEYARCFAQLFGFRMSEAATAPAAIAAAGHESA